VTYQQSSQLTEYCGTTTSRKRRAGGQGGPAPKANKGAAGDWPLYNSFMIMHSSEWKAVIKENDAKFF